MDLVTNSKGTIFTGPRGSGIRRLTGKQKFKETNTRRKDYSGTQARVAMEVVVAKVASSPTP